MEFDNRITREKYQLLCETGDQLIDMIFDDVVAVMDTHQPDPLLNWLPSQFARHYTPLFAKQFLVTVITVTGALDKWDGEFALVTCTAEALALHHVIELTKSRIEVQADMAGRAPAEDDLDFSAFEDLLFPDLDYEFLFRPEWDGIEDSEIAEADGMFLRFDQWFIPYASSGWVHPYCRLG